MEGKENSEKQFSCWENKAINNKVINSNPGRVGGETKKSSPNILFFKICKILLSHPFAKGTLKTLIRKRPGVQLGKIQDAVKWAKMIKGFCYLSLNTPNCMSLAMTVKPAGRFTV